MTPLSDCAQRRLADTTAWDCAEVQAVHMKQGEVRKAATEIGKKVKNFLPSLS